MAPTSLKQLQASGPEWMPAPKRAESRAFEVLRDISRATAGMTGTAFFPGLVRHIGQALGVKFVYLSQLTGAKPGSLRVIASWENGKNGFGFEYPTANTPCGRVIAEGIFVVPEALTEEFPDDHFFRRIGAESYVGVPILDPGGDALGHLCVIDDKRLREESMFVSTLSIFASRAAGEIQRLQTIETIEDSERRQASLLQNLPGIAYRAAAGEHWVRKMKGRACLQITGYEAETLSGEGSPSYEDLIHPEDFPVGAEAPEKVLADSGNFQRAYRIRTKSGEERWVWEQGRGTYAESGELVAVEGMISDITEFKRLEKELRGRAGVLEMLARGASLDDVLSALIELGNEVYPEMIGAVLLLAEGGRKVQKCVAPGLPRYCVEAFEALDLNPGNGILEPVLYQARSMIIQDLTHEPAWTGLGDVLSRTGLRSCWAEPMLSSEGMVLGVLAFFFRELRNPIQLDRVILNDTAQLAGIAMERKLAEDELRLHRLHLEELVRQRTGELKAANQKLQMLSRLDGLTGIANRRFFDECFEREWQRMYREKLPLSLVLIDIDYFKLFNDNYGHRSGDNCLKRVARIIATSVNRPGDVCARYGGEEFVLILPHTDALGARLVAERIRSLIEEMNIEHRASQVADRVTVSLGVAMQIPQPECDPNSLIEKADKALYRAKNQGRNRVVSSL